MQGGVRLGRVPRGPPGAQESCLAAGQRAREVGRCLGVTKALTGAGAAVLRERSRVRDPVSPTIGTRWG